MIAELAFCLDAYHAGTRDRHTTMSNFNLRLLPTFSFDHRSFSVGNFSLRYLALRYLFSEISTFAKAMADEGSTGSKLTSKG